MEKRYDIFYRNPERVDSDTALPGTPHPDTRFAVCINSEREYLIPRNGVWAVVTKVEALRGVSVGAIIRDRQDTGSD